MANDGVFKTNVGNQIEINGGTAVDSSIGYFQMVDDKLECNVYANRSSGDRFIAVRIDDGVPVHYAAMTPEGYLNKTAVYYVDLVFLQKGGSTSGIKEVSL